MQFYKNLKNLNVKIWLCLQSNIITNIYIGMTFRYKITHKSSQTYFLQGRYSPSLLAGPSGIRLGWGIETKGRFEAERPPTSVGPPSGGRAAFWSPMHPLYSTRPHGLVQAIFWHTCPDLDLGPWYCLTHESHIALSGSMTSRVRVSARSRPSPPFYPHFNRPSGFWPCVKSCLVGGSDKYIISYGGVPIMLWLTC